PKSASVTRSPRTTESRTVSMAASMTRPTSALLTPVRFETSATRPPLFMVAPSAAGSNVHRRRTAGGRSNRRIGPRQAFRSAGETTGWRIPTAAVRDRARGAVAGAQGFEPRLTGPEPVVLPLHHAPPA